MQPDTTEAYKGFFSENIYMTQMRDESRGALLKHSTRAGRPKANRSGGWPLPSYISVHSYGYLFSSMQLNKNSA